MDLVLFSAFVIDWNTHASADWALWLVGLHLALSWQWIADCTRRYLWQPLVHGLRLSTKRVEEQPVEVVQ